MTLYDTLMNEVRLIEEGVNQNGQKNITKPNWKKLLKTLALRLIKLHSRNQFVVAFTRGFIIFVIQLEGSGGGGRKKPYLPENQVLYEFIFVFLLLSRLDIVGEQWSGH